MTFSQEEIIESLFNEPYWKWVYGYYVHRQFPAFVTGGFAIASFCNFDCGDQGYYRVPDSWYLNTKGCIDTDFSFRIRIDNENIRKTSP